jgi:hypothetical protein
MPSTLINDSTDSSLSSGSWSGASSAEDGGDDSHGSVDRPLFLRGRRRSDLGISWKAAAPIVQAGGGEPREEAAPVHRPSPPPPDERPAPGRRPGAAAGPPGAATPGGGCAPAASLQVGAGSRCCGGAGEEGRRRYPDSPLAARMLESWQYVVDAGSGDAGGDGDALAGSRGRAAPRPQPAIAIAIAPPSPRSLSLRTVDLVDAMLLCDDDGDIGGEEMPWEEGW